MPAMSKKKKKKKKKKRSASFCLRCRREIIVTFAIESLVTQYYYRAGKSEASAEEGVLFSAHFVVS
jgi:hypothetical protein